MQYGKWKKSQQNRDCLPEIATGAKRPRNDKSGAITVLAIARANRSCSAGPGCPLPYISLCGVEKFPRGGFSFQPECDMIW